nr:hypothetical protein [Tanacetum cinerariifolium]
MAKGKIDNLTMEQYLALTRGNHAPGVVKPEIGGNVNFEIKSQFMWELKEDTFSENMNDNAHEHVQRVLDIVSLFNILGVLLDAVMLRVFPITLIGAAKRRVDRLPPGTFDSWDLLKKPLSKGTVHHQRLPSSLKKSATSSRKETKHYTKLGNGIMIFYINAPPMTSIAIRSIEASREAHDKIIQGLETKVKTLANEVEGRTNNGKFKEGKAICTEDGLPLYTPFYYSPKEIEYFFANSGFSNDEKQETDDSGMAKPLAALEAILKKKKEEPKKEKHNINYYVDPYEPLIPFPRRLEQHAKESLVHQTIESLKNSK